MKEFSFENVELYDWIPFFGELAEKLKKVGPGEELRGYVKESLGEDNALEQKDAFDPFSFIYTLASKNTTNQKQDIFNKVKEVFGLEKDVPTDWLFPKVRSIIPTLFKGEKEYNPSLLWDMFRKSLEEGLTDEDCKKLTDQDNVGISKLTQTLFLIDPKKYLPIDGRLEALVLSDKVDKAHLIETMGKVKEQFPGCEFYEINLFNYLFLKQKLTINEKYWQTSTNIHNDDKDCWEKFNNESAVRTGDEQYTKDKYHVEKVKQGDVILCHFRQDEKKGKGIGIVLDNEYYRNGQWTDGEWKDKKIKVLWINKKQIENVLHPNSRQTPGFSEANEIKNKFEKKYPETFELLKRIREMQKNLEKIINDKKNLILQGAPGTGKTYLAKQLALYLTQENGIKNPMREYLAEGKECSDLFTTPACIEGREDVRLIQFHPSYSYEDFVRGIVAKTQGSGITYTVENKVLADLAEKAIGDPGKNYVLIIDEINRANLPAVLGELIYALEYRGEPVKSMYALEDGEGSNDEIILPHNLYIIGTMNTADRSIGHIDYAIRRRFIFQEIGADVNVIDNGKAKELFDKVATLFKEHLSLEFKKEDVQIGHSYFMVEGDEELEMRWDHEIKPILNEYLKDGVLLESAKEEIKKIYQ